MCDKEGPGAQHRSLNLFMHTAKDKKVKPVSSDQRQIT